MNSNLIIIFAFIIIVTLISNHHENEKAKYKSSKKKDEKEKAEKAVNSESREQLLHNIDMLSKRIENLEVLLKEKNKNGN